MYYQKARSETVEIGGKLVTVDSQLEKKVITWLEQNGYHGLWEKPSIGINLADSHYTPDLLLSVMRDNKTTLAIVEIKPTIAHLTQNIKKRMVGVCNYHSTKLLLIWADKEKSWYILDPSHVTTAVTAQPSPGNMPINKLYKPLSLSTIRRGNHTYQKQFNPIVSLFEGTTKTLLGILGANPKQKRRRKH